MTFALSAPAGELAAAAHHAASVIASRNTIPMWENLHIEVASGTAKITGIGPDETAMAELEAEGTGSVTIPGNQLAIALGGLPGDAEVKLLVVDGSAKLTCGRFSQLFNTLPASDFPVYSPVSDGHKITLYADQLSDMLPVLSGACLRPSQKTGRKYLEGIYFDFQKGCLVATNAHVMLRLDAPWGEFGKDDERPPSFILPFDAIGPLKSLLARAATVDLEFFNAGHLVQFSRAGRHFRSKVIDGEFPQYERMIPAAQRTEVRVSVATMMTALKRVSSVPTEENFRAVRLRIGDGHIFMASKDGSGGYAEDACDAELLSGKGCEFAVAIEYMSWALRSFAKETEVIFKCEDDKTPASLFAVESTDTKAIRLLGPRTW